MSLKINPPNSTDYPSTTVILTLKKRPLWAIALRSPYVFLKHYRILRKANTRFGSAYAAYCMTKLLFNNRHLKDG